MGMNLFFRTFEQVDTPKKDHKHTIEVVKRTTEIIKGNPNPRNYKILKSEEIGKYLIVKIKYPDCKNYEGIKILLFKNCTIFELTNQELIDPHFSDNKNFFSPIARFQPTNEGWKNAIFLVNSLTK